MKTFLSVATVAAFSVGLISSAYAAPTSATAPAQAKVLKGRVLAGGQPVADAYIKLDGTLNTTFSNADGSFQLTPETDKQLILIVNKPGYKPLRREIRLGTTHVDLELEPQKISDPTLPPAYSLTPNNPIRLYESAIAPIYRLRYQGIYQGNVEAAGWVTNEIGLEGQFRQNQWLLSGGFSRNRTPIDISGFPSNPAFNVDQTQGRIGAAVIWPLDPEVLELAVGATYLVQNSLPDNKNSSDGRPVPYSNTFLDFETWRHGPGAQGLLAWRPAKDVVLSGQAGLFPFMFAHQADSPATPLGWSGLVQLRLQGAYKVYSGTHLTAFYENQSWLGNWDISHILGIGLSIAPGEVVAL